MKTKYLLITASKQIDATSQIWWLMVGTSKQARADLLFMTAYAADNNYYFAHYSGDACTFMQRVINSVNGVLQINTADVRDYVRATKQRLAMPIDSHVALQSHAVRKLMSRSYDTACCVSRAVATTTKCDLSRGISCPDTSLHGDFGALITTPVIMPEPATAVPPYDNSDNVPSCAALPSDSDCQKSAFWHNI